MASITWGSSGTTGGRGGRRLIRGAAVVGASTAALMAGQLPASAATDPYGLTHYGYDVSYPQCPSGAVPAAPAGATYTFAIIGVGGGRPFTSSSCAGAQEAGAAADSSISNIAYYFNTGYAGAYARNIDPVCSTDVANNNVGGVSFGSGHAASQNQQAWEIGCSEALYAKKHAPAGSPTMWWADVETGNSWSTNTTLNDFCIDGLVFQMQQEGAPGGGGIYSYTNSWNKIAGPGFVPTPAENANWDAFVGDNFNTVGYEVVQNGTSGAADTDLGS